MATRAAKLALRGKALSDTGTEIGIVNNADATAITIDSSEKVGINNSSPTQRLEINGNAQFNMYDNGSGAGGYYTTKGMQIGNAFDAGLSGGDDDRNAIVWNERGTSLLFGTNNIEYMRIDSAGNVGIGVTPETWHSNYTALQVGGTGSISSSTTAAAGADTHYGQNMYLATSGDWKYQVTDQASVMSQNDGKFRFRVAPSGSADAAITFTAALEILPYDTTLDMYRGVQIKTDGLRSAIGTFRQTTSNSAHIEFRNTNGFIGSIKTNGTATSFNTSSDYRLKENVDYTWDATTRLKQLKPARFNFISDDTNTLVDGFLAHEVSSVVPEAIGGTKDATETLTSAVVMPNGISVGSNITEADWTTGVADGTYPADSTWSASHTQDVWQSIDQSKLVPLLVKTIQELEARITILEA